MTNDERNPKLECRTALSCAIAGFVIRISSFLRISSFVIRVCELQSVQCKRPVSGLGVEDSRNASFGFSPCIGTMNPPLTPPRRGTEGKQIFDLTMPRAGLLYRANAIVSVPSSRCSVVRGEIRFADRTAGARLAGNPVRRAHLDR